LPVKAMVSIPSPPSIESLLVVLCRLSVPDVPEIVAMNSLTALASESALALASASAAATSNKSKSSKSSSTASASAMA
jgi:hypothetical protein